MIVVDTSIWIEFLKRNEPVFSRMQEILENGEVLAVECVFAELMQGAATKRERNIISGYWRNLSKNSMDGLLLRAGEESGRKKWLAKGIGLIDSAIVAYAREARAQIWTSDKKMMSILTKDESFS